MKSSESETESECFESAAESLDEEEESSVISKSKVTKCLRESKKEVVKPVVSFTDSVDADDKAKGEDFSNNSFKYRKRPERVKRLSSKSPTRINEPRKTSVTESLFKPDNIIQPDAFFQDITSNLSRNINKSLNTLQQKSSNVKDLILNSLPVAPANESEVFSYDDPASVYSEPVDISQTSKNASNSDLSSDSHSKHPVESVPSRTEEKTISVDNNEHVKKSKSIHKEPKKQKESNKNKRRKPEKSFKENIEEKLVDEQISQFEVPHVKESSGPKPENDSFDCSETNIESGCVSQLNETHFEGDSENLNAENLSKSEDLGPEEVIYASLSEKLKDVEGGEKIIINELLDSHSFDKSSDGPVKDDGDLNESSIDILAKQEETDSKCNLEELKTALKNIVKDDINISQTETKEQEEADEAEKVLDEITEGSKDGWDDFDFSDNEIEDSGVNKCNESAIEAEKENLQDQLSTEQRNFEGVRSEQVGLKDENFEVSKDVQRKMETKEGNLVRREIQKSENEKQESKSEAVSDGWDWDGWDEVSESAESETEKQPPTEKTETRKTDELFDVQKWSGWDNFGRKQEEKPGNWSLGSWGMNMLLNKATAVTQGISNVLEAGLGAPDPETLARMEKLEREKLKEEKRNDGEREEFSKEVSKKNSASDVNLFPDFGITDLVAGVTSKIVDRSMIQEIGSKVISGGLDTLENFGKKTMEVLQEGDPGLRNKRALLLGHGEPVLSQILKEAREKADRELKKVEEKELAKKCHFETLFDDCQGLVHLEALEMLSRQCELKLEQIRSTMNTEEQEDLDGILEEVEQLCSLDDYDLDLKSSVTNFQVSLKMAVKPLENEISVSRITEIHEKVSMWLKTSVEGDPSSTMIHQKVVSTLAELTAATVHQFHKAGELLAVKECRKTVEEVDALSKLTSLLSMEINNLCQEFSTLLFSKCSQELSKEDIKLLNDKILTVTKNSISYIRQAFNLLIPVVQVGAAV